MSLRTEPPSLQEEEHRHSLQGEEHLRSQEEERHHSQEEEHLRSLEEERHRSLEEGHHHSQEEGRHHMQQWKEGRRHRTACLQLAGQRWLTAARRRLEVRCPGTRWRSCRLRRRLRS